MNVGFELLNFRQLIMLIDVSDKQNLLSSAMPAMARGGHVPATSPHSQGPASQPLHVL